MCRSLPPGDLLHPSAAVSVKLSWYLSPMAQQEAAMLDETPKPKLDLAKLLGLAAPGAALRAAQKHALENQAVREAAVASITGRGILGLKSEPVFQVRNQAVRNQALRDAAASRVLGTGGGVIALKQ